MGWRGAGSSTHLHNGVAVEVLVLCSRPALLEPLIVLFQPVLGGHGQLGQELVEGA